MDLVYVKMTSNSSMKAVPYRLHTSAEFEKKAFESYFLEHSEFFFLFLEKGYSKKIKNKFTKYHKIPENVTKS